ncbi:hypothetical protein ABB37_03873 [Leptomonas pyrrhocoris]|uniref:Uncharacterized protein n=1 Tax=Leptomonas pyrrhocoris TaxID=157538 RepID=A0A0M9G3R7_LEPPY|nr:hypothetical protein ABB37_03873 [Leptomonas pyrrhocoris]XP_015659965.1 hypothetical protein ABB37_03873 [Leptomonas pyrrhocoris]KPA81525.1 hypothetical protein ABB37_03873 [Leptomonas pyrrhocoris]KPA81526.1 hypothetical protein ABB37_03873 [Leptomonas pyrrhocoris]|eukprot:XP_015659964.1 hypothetical protein ABB37_03873 [Leptomonas pyrrhocoris]
MKAESGVRQPGEPGYVKRMTHIILSLVVLVVMPLYVYREVTLLRTLATAPVSRVILFGAPLDPRKLAQRLNPHGEPIYMSNVVAATNGSCDAAAAVPEIPKGQITAVTFNVDDTERHGVVYIPNSYPSVTTATTTRAASPAPMLVLFHGLNDNCEHFLNATGFIPYAEQHSFVLVSACGSQGYLGTAWNSGTCCGFSGDKPNDVAFAQKIVKDMSETVCVDERKVMAVGFSNGAMLSEVLACEAPDVFQATVSIGGVVELRPGNAEGLARCTEKVRAKQHRASVLMVHGTSDAMVPWGGNRFLGFPSIDANLAAWVERNDCAADKKNSTIHTKTYTNTIYDHCGAATANVATDDAAVKIALRHENRMHLPAERTAREAFETPAPRSGSPSLRVQVEPLGVHRKHGKRVDRDDEDHDEEREDREGRMEKHHHPKMEKRTKGRRGPHRRLPEDRPHRGGGRHPRHPTPCVLPPVGEKQAKVDADSAISQIELVKVEGGAHSWPEDKEFSTTEYIIQFGARVFGGYPK